MSDSTTMTREHPRFREFCERLAGPEGVNFRDGGERGTVWNCDNTMNRPQARKILADMGLTPQQITASLRYFSRHGGYCDCEILFNVDRDRKGD